MTTGRSDGGAARLLDGTALALFTAHAALRLSLRGGDGSWGANLSAHLLVPLAAAVWLTARALERKLPWRLTGLEIPLAALVAMALITTLGASFRLAAMDGAAGFATAILAVPLAVHLFGSQGRGALIGLLGALVTVVALYGCVQFVQLGELQTEKATSQAIEASEDPGELEGRVKAREPWSTLNYPNTFAGFLVLALPFILGRALDSKSKLVTGAGIVILAAGAFGLWASGSAGAWVAAAAAGIAFVVLEAMRRRPQWRKPILLACGAAVALAAILVAAGPLSPNALAKRSEAIAIRDVYWDAALRVSKDHPFGVGLNNFEDYYYDHKDDRQEEVRQVHNDYLQILAELGVPGLLAFLALLAAAAFMALRPPAEEPPAPVETVRTPLMAGLGIGWLVAFGLQGIFGHLGTTLLLAVAGIGAFWIFARDTGTGEFTRLGLAAGLAGAAVHLLVDFDLGDPAFRHYFFLSLAALALTSRLEPPSLAGAAAPAIAAVVLFAMVLPLAAAVAPRFLEAEELASKAAESEALGRDEEAGLLWEAAATANPLDPDSAVRRGLLERNLADETRRSDLVITILEDALRRRPRSASIEARLAEVHESVARRLQEGPREGTGIEAASARAHETEAELHARRAVELYPTRAYHRYLLGRILDSSGQDGAPEFRKALRLSALAVRVPRLALDGVQAALATLRTGGGRDRAVAIFRAWREKQEKRPGFAERWRARLPLLTPEEKSIVDAAAESK